MFFLEHILFSSLGNYAPGKIKVQTRAHPIASMRKSALPMLSPAAGALLPFPSILPKNSVLRRTFYCSARPHFANRNIASIYGSVDTLSLLMIDRDLWSLV